MDLSDYTIAGGFLPRFKCDTVAVVVDRLAARILEDETPEVVAEVARKVMTREAEVSTAIGGGLIIPHARFRGISRARLGVATLAEPLDVPSEDGQPIDIVILLLGPAGDPRQMLRVLARLARLVRQESFLQGLREAQSPDALRNAFAKAGDA
jgi:PTS system nitrogen regulatory IIA component